MGFLKAALRALSILILKVYFVSSYRLEKYIAGLEITFTLKAITFYQCGRL